MLLCYHGRHTQLRALRAAYPSPDAGLNLSTLTKIARDEGLAPRAVRLDMHELGELNLPCILHWDYNHYVVLEQVTSCLLYTSPSPRDATLSRMPSSA